MAAVRRRQRTREARAAIRLHLNVTARKEVILLRFVDAGRNMAQRVRVGIDEPMTGGDVARRSDADEAESSAAWMRFVNALM